LKLKTEFAFTTCKYKLFLSYCMSLHECELLLAIVILITYVFHGGKARVWYGACLTILIAFLFLSCVSVYHCLTRSVDNRYFIQSFFRNDALLVRAVMKYGRLLFTCLHSAIMHCCAHVFILSTTLLMVKSVDLSISLYIT